MSEQIAVRLPSSTLRQLDELVRSGSFASRAEGVRTAVDRLVEQWRQEQIDAAIVAGYTRHPQTNDEVAAAEITAIRSIAEEPW
ncbi:MAG: ribbon-helix-helix domain-containing protein [Actinomycetota bacterium]